MKKIEALLLVGLNFINIFLRHKDPDNFRALFGLKMCLLLIPIYFDIMWIKKCHLTQAVGAIGVGWK